MDMSGKTVVVLGGGAGIGRAGALEFAARGANLVIGDIDDDASRETVELIRRSGRTAIDTHYDAASEVDAAAVADVSRSAFGEIAVVWSHAGTSLAGPPERIPVDRWRALLDVNLLSTVRCLQAFVEDLGRSRGRWVITSSGLGLFPEDVPGLAAPYAVTKAAQIALARNIAPYLAMRGVEVSVLVPDQTDTRHAREVNTVGLPAEAATAALDAGAVQTPKQVAEALVSGVERGDFLISTIENTHRRLVAAADRLYAPVSDGRGGAAGGTVLQYVRIEADPGRHAPLAEALVQMAAQVRAEPGATVYEVSADLSEPGVFHLFEQWESAAHLEGHATSAAAREAVGRLTDLGVTHATTRLYHGDEIGPPRPIAR
jgi:NAD(P)-dependent dehydrogenase (short-subunit alcohol dehydrogenase family)/quinol monooxygenase YgiN